MRGYERNGTKSKLGESGNDRNGETMTRKRRGETAVREGSLGEECERIKMWNDTYLRERKEKEQPAN